MEGISRFRRWRLTVAVAVVAVVALGSAGAVYSGANNPPLNVFVTNNATSAVPVTVTNSQPIPIAFQVETNTTILEGHNTGRASVDVPAGMQLILERVSGRVRVPTGQAVYVALSCLPVAGGDGQFTWFTPELFAGSFPPNDGLFFNEAVLCYAGPGRTVYADATRYQTADQGEFVISFFGHLLPQP